MQRTLLLLTALVLLGATAPLAAAQSQAQTTTTEIAVETSGPLAPGNQTALAGVVTYTYPATGQLEMTGTPITVKVTEKPEWATVVVTPSSFVIPVSGLEFRMVVEKTENIQVQVHVDESAPAGASGVIAIQAVAHNNGNLDGSTGETSMLLATASGDPCTTTSTSEDVTVQGFTGEPVGFLGLAPAEVVAVAGIGATVGLAGAAAGRILRRREA